MTKKPAAARSLSLLSISFIAVAWMIRFYKLLITVYHMCSLYLLYVVLLSHKLWSHRSSAPRHQSHYNSLILSLLSNVSAPRCIIWTLQYEFKAVNRLTFTHKHTTNKAIVAVIGECAASEQWWQTVVWRHRKWEYYQYTIVRHWFRYSCKIVNVCWTNAKWGNRRFCISWDNKKNCNSLMWRLNIDSNTRVLNIN